ALAAATRCIRRAAGFAAGPAVQGVVGGIDANSAARDCGRGTRASGAASRRHLTTGPTPATIAARAAVRRIGAQLSASPVTFRETRRATGHALIVLADLADGAGLAAADRALSYVRIHNAWPQSPGCASSSALLPADHACGVVRTFLR